MKNMNYILCVYTIMLISIILPVGSLFAADDDTFLFWEQSNREEFNRLTIERSQFTRKQSELSKDLISLQAENNLIPSENYIVETIEKNRRALEIKRENIKSLEIILEQHANDENFDIDDALEKYIQLILSTIPLSKLEELGDAKLIVELTIEKIKEDVGALSDEIERNEALIITKRKIITGINSKSSELSVVTRNLLDVESKIVNILTIDENENKFRVSISFAFVGLVGVVIFGFYILAFFKNEIASSIFSGEKGIQFVTLFLIVIAIILFGIMGVLEGKELAALLGGLSGYILGRSSRINNGDQAQ